MNIDTWIAKWKDYLLIDKKFSDNTIEKYEKNLSQSGYIITDNMNFHGLVEKSENEIPSRNLRALVRKIKEYKAFLENKTDYEVEFLNIGDGIAVAKKIEK